MALSKSNALALGSAAVLGYFVLSKKQEGDGGGSFGGSAYENEGAEESSPLAAIKDLISSFPALPDMGPASFDLTGIDLSDTELVKKSPDKITDYPGFVDRYVKPVYTGAVNNLGVKKYSTSTGGGYNVANIPIPAGITKKSVSGRSTVTSWGHSGVNYTNTVTNTPQHHGGSSLSFANINTARGH